MTRRTPCHAQRRNGGPFMWMGGNNPRGRGLTMAGHHRHLFWLWLRYRGAVIEVVQGRSRSRGGISAPVAVDVAPSLSSNYEV